MVLSDFLRNLERGQAHVSRETDRALRRFHKAKAIAVEEATGSAPDASADDR